MKFFFMVIMLFVNNLLADVYSKSAVVYYGYDISYTTVGIHDYIIVQPEHINTSTSGFKTYRDKIYAYVSIGEIDRGIKEYKYLKKEWIATKNKFWNSDVLDIKNKEYQNFMFEHLIEPRMKEGFKNFFFDTLDSYNLYSKNDKDRKENEEALASFINEFHKRYPKSKLIVNRGFEIIDKIHNSIEAVLFESYYSGISSNKKQPYKDISDGDREWFDIWLNKIKSYNKDIISVEYMDYKDINTKKADNIIEKLKQHNFIPFISDKDLTIYGKSSKNAIKREIFTLIDEKYLDRTLLEAHQYGALILEYLGYKQKLYDINRGLPKVKNMLHYGGVVIWLRDYYSNPKKLIKWVNQLVKHDIKVVFVGNFGFEAVHTKLLKHLGIKVSKRKSKKINIAYQDEMIGYEVSPPMYNGEYLVKVKNGKKLLTYKYKKNKTSTPVAITKWGGYMVDDGVTVDIDGENIWIVDPFKFFVQALRLKKLPVGDVTTQNGKRIFFTHIDGDGLANRVEGNFGKYSGDAILNHILKVYKVPHSVSIIGSDIDKKGPFYKINDELVKIVKDMYKLENVEGATHTYTHPFFWGKIVNDNLKDKYRIKVKDYQFSLKHELLDTLDEINEKFYPSDKKPKANSIFWSGDCAPMSNALDFVYKHNILAINGGDTTITTTKPWLIRIAPLGLQRDNYIQVYTGAQNENVYTNDWLGPFWGFKRVTQTFQLTNSPRRFKPIDIYYHIYSGSKQASLEALTYVFDWSLKRDIFPLFTSEYIPKVMEFYDYSLAHDGKDNWLFCGLNNLQTIRIEDKDKGIDLKNSDFIGIKHFENHTYISLKKSDKYIFKIKDIKDIKNSSYMVSSNGKVTKYSVLNGVQSYEFESYVPLKIELFVKKNCRMKIKPKVTFMKKDNNLFKIEFKKSKKAKVDIVCL